MSSQQQQVIVAPESALAQLKRLPEDPESWKIAANTLAVWLRDLPPPATWKDIHAASKAVDAYQLSLKKGFKKVPDNIEKLWAELMALGAPARDILRAAIHTKLQERLNLQLKSLIWLDTPIHHELQEGGKFPPNTVVFIQDKSRRDVNDDWGFGFGVSSTPRIVVDVDWNDSKVTLAWNGQLFTMTLDQLMNIEYKSDRYLRARLDLELKRAAAGQQRLIGWHKYIDALKSAPEDVMRIPFMQPVSGTGNEYTINSVFPVLALDAGGGLIYGGTLTTLSLSGQPLKLTSSLDPLWKCQSQSTDEFTAWFEGIKNQLKTASGDAKKRLEKIVKSPNKYWGEECFRRELLTTDQVRKLVLKPQDDIIPKYQNDVNLLNNQNVFGRANKSSPAAAAPPQVPQSMVQGAGEQRGGRKRTSYRRRRPSATMIIDESIQPQRHLKRMDDTSAELKSMDNNTRKMLSLKPIRILKMMATKRGIVYDKDIDKDELIDLLLL